MRTKICRALTTHRRLDSTTRLVQQTRESCLAAAQLPHLHTATARASLPTAGGRRPRACTWRDARGTRLNQLHRGTGTRAGNSAAARARDCDVERTDIEIQSCRSERRSLHGGGLRRSSRWRHHERGAGRRSGTITGQPRKSAVWRVSHRQYSAPLCLGVRGPALRYCVASQVV